MKKVMKASTPALVATLLTTGLVVGYFAHVALAGGIPASTPLTYSGLLEDASGAPRTGWTPIDFRLFDAVTAGTKQCEVLSPTSGAHAGYDLGTSGRFSITLPSTSGNDCTAAVKAHPDLWVEVAVGGVALPRTKLGAVPYAVEAAHATAADTATNATNAATANTAGGTLATNISTLQQNVGNLMGRTDLKVFVKPGDNATQSCDYFCTSNLGFGPSGTCVAALISTGTNAGQYVNCTFTNNGATNLTCWCASP